MKLFQPGKIGSMTLRNRVVMAPLSTNFPSVSGEISPEYTAFYLERAKGGVGLIILEWANVDYPLGKSGYTQIRLDDDCYIPMLCQFTEIIHETGAKVCLQLNHAGGMFGDRGRSDLTPIAASASVYGKNKRMAREATIEEIRQIEKKFVDAAERAQMAGFDAIELHGATSYLISNFLSPWTNLRQDEYGGSVENRARFAVEIVEGIKAKCGRDFPVLFRISADEMVEAGRHLDESVQVVNLLKQAGIDCVHVTAGAGKDPAHPSRRAHICPTGYPQGWKSYLAREIGQRCKITTIAVGSIRDVEVAERIVNEDADFVAMARQLVADPQWVNKARKGETIRKCVSCNSCVLHRSIYGSKLRCCVNPMAGKEYRLLPPEQVPAEVSKRVAVVGGGPAGMEAAVVAAVRGHQVTLFEQQGCLGGELIPACGADMKYKFRWLIDWLTGEVERLKIDVRLNTKATGQMLSQSDFDTVIVATGSLPRLFPPVKEYYENHKDDPKLLLATEYLGKQRDVPPNAKKALILGAGNIGQEAAYMLGKRGLQVLLLEGYRTKENLMTGDINNAMELMDAMLQVGVEILDHTQILSLTEDVLLASVAGQTIPMEYDVILIAQGLIPDDQLIRELGETTKDVICIGNVLRDRTAFYAMHEGFTAGYYL